MEHLDRGARQKQPSASQLDRRGKPTRCAVKALARARELGVRGKLASGPTRLDDHHERRAARATLGVLVFELGRVWALTPRGQLAVRLGLGCGCKGAKSGPVGGALWLYRRKRKKKRRASRNARLAALMSVEETRGADSFERVRTGLIDHPQRGCLPALACGLTR